MKTWRFVVPILGNVVMVRKANTKSEARGILKKDLKFKRLPSGLVAKEVANR